MLTGADPGVDDTIGPTCLQAKSRRLALTTTSLVGLVALVLTTGCGSERSSADQTSSAGQTTSRALRCTGQDEPTNFTAYSLGPEFEKLPLTSQSRVCNQAPPGRPPEERLNIVEYSYGSCNPGPGERCPSPLSVQNWPRCERDPSDYAGSLHNPLKRRLEIRGVPAHVYEGGGRLEIFTGASTVVVFGNEEAQIVRAGRALVKAPAKPSAEVTGGDATAPLPAPPPGAVLACSS